MVRTVLEDSSRFIPQRLDPATNNELSEIWSRVQSRVLALADGDQRKIRPLGVNDVLSHLDAAQKKDKVSSWKAKDIKDSFNKTLLFIQTVSSITAGAASQQGYQGIFEELAGLLEKCTEYLDRLEYHVHGGMDTKLSKVACQHLLLFVEICDRTVKLRSKRRKLLAGARILFLQDNGVTDLLARMESLVDEENRLVVAQTSVLASDAATNSKANLALMQGLVDSFAEDRADQKKEKDKKSREQVVLKALAFDETKTNQDSGEPEAFWQTIYRNYLGQQGMVRFLQRASIPIPGRDIRVLVTGDPSCFEQLSKIGNTRFDCMSISTNNRSDVEKFIENRMDKMPALNDRTRLGIPELRDNIRARLCAETQGDYFKIDKTLDHISSLEYKTNIKQALDDASKERSQQITEEIKKMNESRSEKELLEINEIIRWIVYGKDVLTPKQMSAALYVRNGETSLLPLEQKSKIKYSLFEVDRNVKVDFRSSEIERYIPLKKTTHDLEDSYSKEAAQAAEVAMIKHFLLTVCPSEVYTKLKFDAYLAQLSKPKGSRINKDEPHTGETKMALTCLDILTEKTDRKRTRLLTYARKYLINHLSTVDLALADIACKSAVGVLLAKLFTEGSSIDILLHCAESVDDPNLRYKIRRYWLYSNDSVNTILRWFGDSAVTSEITDTATRAWVASVASEAESDEDLMRPAAEGMAVHFLQEAHSESFTKDAFLFIAGFVNKVKTLYVENGGHVDYGVQGVFNYDISRNFFNRLGVQYKPVTPGSLINKYVNFKTGHEVSPPSGVLDTVAALLVYRTAIQKYDYLKDGIYNLPDPVPEELLWPFSKFVEKYKFEGALNVIYTFANALGDMLASPTLYVIQLFGISHIDIFLQGGYITPNNGMYELYRKASEELGTDVVYNSKATKATRSDTEIKIITHDTSGKKILIKAKNLLITFPPIPENLKGFDLSPEEISLSSKLFWKTYYVAVLKNTGIPSNINVHNVNPDEKPGNLPVAPFQWALQDMGPNNYLASKLIGDMNFTDTQAQELIIGDLHRMGAAGTFDIRKDWEMAAFGNHNPTTLMVGVDDIKDGFYSRFYDLQGRRGTYWTGLTLVSDYSALLWKYTESVVERIVKGE
ncbi:unnamed protein product [Aspergillus oryzae]|nr:unnamed protein product [Aspergillus oryzae]GMF95476.1 unnamed protein product [Aspergillus oryzae]